MRGRARKDCKKKIYPTCSLEPTAVGGMQVKFGAGEG